MLHEFYAERQAMEDRIRKATEVWDTEIEDSIMAENEGKLFSHIWLHQFGGEYSVQKNYYTILNGRVFIIEAPKNENEKHSLYPTNDTAFNTERLCVKVGKYDPNKSYQRVTKYYSYREFKLMTKVGK